MMDSDNCSNDNNERYRIWGKYIFLICLFAGLIITLIVSDFYWTVHFAIAILVIWFLVPSAKDETSGNVSGLIALIHSEIRNSNQPEIDFRNIILRLRHQEKISEPAIIKILESFSTGDDEVGIESKKILKSIQ
ncbi:MAG: hypothetical protein ACTSV2_17660 [Candidatus Thorarchaeota archaeon]